jgi:hypothetical protein
MRDLSGTVMAPLVNSSMNAGNTTASNPELAMTAPGSESVLPVSERLDVLPQPRYTNATPIPVSHPGIHDRVAHPAGPDGAGPAWTDAHQIPREASRWKELTGG